MLGASHLKQLIAFLIYLVKEKMPFYIAVCEEQFVSCFSEQNGLKGINYLHEFHLLQLTKLLPSKQKTIKKIIWFNIFTCSKCFEKKFHK